MDLYGTVLVALMALPFVAVGYVMGMLHMRSNYLRLLKGARIDNRRAMRYVEQRAKNERYLGYAVGYREGSRR